METDVLIIGGGPAGLSAATELRRDAATDVLVLEREAAAGGVPRYCDHPGYGIRDLGRFMSGPRYAQRIADTAARSGATIRTQAMVTGWTHDGRAEVTSPGGRFVVDAKAIVLATGARERPRPARLVPGDRPDGVYTTGQLQSTVHSGQSLSGRKAVIVGAELVSWSAVVTLHQAGSECALMVSGHEVPESYRAFTLAGRLGLRTPVAARSKVTAVLGKGRVEGVEVADLVTGIRRVVPCDMVVFTGDWIPDSELARSAGLDMDHAFRGPVVDTALRTSRPGVFAAGNLLHPVDTADVAALDGRHVAAQVRSFLSAGAGPADGVRVRVEPPLRWVSPGILRPGDPAPSRGRFLLWADSLVPRPRVTVRQGGADIASQVLPWPAAPGRVFRVPSRLLRGVDYSAGDVTIALGRR